MIHHSAKQRILITGATGFVGTALAEELAGDSRYEVWVLERYVTGRYASQHLYPTVFADLRYYYDVVAALRQAQPHIIIHLAALSPVSYSLEGHPQEVNETNFIGTINLVEAAKKYLPNLEHFIIASTSETYGNIPAPFKEEDAQKPVSPYGVSKLAAEKYAEYIYRAFDLPISIARPFNTYGRVKDHHFFVESVIYQMLTSDVVRLGNPDSSRDLIYVADHVSGYKAILANPEKSIGQIFNLCSGQNNQIRDVAELIRRIIGWNGEIYWNQLPKRADDIKVLYGSNDRARAVLNWAPQISLEDGLRRTIKNWQIKLGRI